MGLDLYHEILIEPPRGWDSADGHGQQGVHKHILGPQPYDDKGLVATPGTAELRILADRAGWVRHMSIPYYDMAATLTARGLDTAQWRWSRLSMQELADADIPADSDVSTDPDNGKKWVDLMVMTHVDDAQVPYENQRRHDFFGSQIKMYDILQPVCWGKRISHQGSGMSNDFYLDNDEPYRLISDLNEVKRIGQFTDGPKRRYQKFIADWQDGLSFLVVSW